MSLSRNYESFAIDFETAKKLYGFINGVLVQEVAGPNGDLSSGLLHDFASKEAIFDETLKGAMGTQLKNYIEACKKLIAGWVLDLRIWAQDARDGLQVAIDAEAQNANTLASVVDERKQEAQNAYDEAQNIETELDLTNYNRAQTGIGAGSC